MGIIPANTSSALMYPSAVPNNQQVVIPQITIPQPTFSPLPSTYTQQNNVSHIQGPQLNRVKGLDGAKAFITQANAMYALFDEDDDVMYVKVTDGNNYPVSLKRYRFIEEEEPSPPEPPQYVTMEEFNKFKEEMLNAKQSIRAKHAKSTDAIIDE